MQTEFASYVDRKDHSSINPVTFILKDIMLFFFRRVVEDTIANAVALSPNCHKKCHHAQDTEVIREEIRNKIERILTSDR